MGERCVAGRYFRPHSVPAFLCAVALSLAGVASAQGYLIRSLDGTFFNERLGMSVANAGDVDGDGVPDQLVAGQNTTNGIVRLFSGASGAVLFTDVGAVNDYFGRGLASLGDVTGDGVPDFAAGGPQFAGAPGYVKVYSAATGSLLYTLTGPNSQSYLGQGLAGVGDVNGDGLPDLLVGDPGVFSNTGQAKVFSGPTGALLLTINGTIGESFFGWSVAGPGDVSGDGVPDLLVGAPGTFATNQPGQARVFSGAGGGVIFTFSGTATNDHLGRAVAGAGDVSGDGVPDLLVGAPQEGGGPGYAKLFSGGNGNVLLTVTGAVFDEKFGSSVAGVGDVSGDGVLDFLVGAPTASTGDGFARLFSGANGTVLDTFAGIGDERLGTSVAGGGDLDGDGVPDLLVGGMHAAPSGVSDAGRAKAISFPGIPLGSFPFGSGCPGSGGFVPIVQTAGGFPSSGGNAGFGFFLSRSLGGTTAVLIVGTSFQSWLGTPLPLDLAFLGMPGCSLRVSADLLIPTVTAGAGSGAGKAFVPLAVPADPSLVATFVFFQWIVADPGPALPPGSMTSGLKLLIL
jgi:hypothetical protein